MELMGQAGILCVVFWISFSLAAAATTPTTTPPSTTAANNTGQEWWSDYAQFSQNGIGVSYIMAIPFTYYECITNYIQVSNMGYVLFGAHVDSPSPPPPSQWPAGPKYLGVYWANMQGWYANKSDTFTYFDSGRLKDIAYEHSLITYVKRVVGEPEFEPLVLLALTWKDVRPASVKDFPNDTATFQVIIATDSQVTYAIRNYLSVWQSPPLANETYYSATYSLENGAAPNVTAPGINAGPEVIRLGTKKPNKDPYTCVQKTQTAVARLNSSLYELPPCHCFLSQADRDPQFKISSVSSSCYQSIDPPSGGSLYQLCCYNQYGLLIKLGKDARVPVSAVATDRSLQDAYESCCAAGSGLCEWFYYRIYQPKCDNSTQDPNSTALARFYNSEDLYVFYSSSKATLVRRHLSVRSVYPVNLSASTVFNSSHGFQFDGTWFAWDVARGRDQLRKMSYPQRLVFYATDANNDSTSYAPLYKLCLCEQADQCDVNAFGTAGTKDVLGMNTFFGLDNYESGNVNSMPCNCKDNGAGRFCEKPRHVCDDCLVNQTTDCSAKPQNYCPACPAGYTRTGYQCRAGTRTCLISGCASGHTMSLTQHATGTQFFLFILLSVISSCLPWLQNWTSHL